MRAGRAADVRLNTRTAYETAPTMRRLGGSAFRKVSASSSKAEANVEAKTLRNNNWKARVVKRKMGSRTYYIVYRGSSRSR